MSSRRATRRARTRRPRRTWTQRLLIAFNLFLALACVAAAFTFNQVKTSAKKVPYVSVGFSLAPKTNTDQPRNILLIGTDSAEGLDPDDPVRNGRDDFGTLADVIMILRIDPGAGTASLLSIPRDTWVPTAPFGKKEKINAAINGNRGAENLITTIKENFGIPIQNFAEVDFAGFRDLVDVLGGIPIYLNMPIRDQHTGLYQEQLGCITLDPVQALAYARSRHFEYFDGKKWRDDPTADLGRITRQQDFLRAAGQRAVQKGIRNPAAALGLVDAATKSVTLDPTLSVGQILDILNLFRSFNLDSLQAVQIPTIGVRRGDADTQDVVWSQAVPLLKPYWGIVDGRDPTPNDVLLEVAAGSDVEGLTRQFEQLGFDADPPADGDTGSGGSSTVISFGANGLDAAMLLARYIDGPVRLSKDSSLPGRRIRLEAARTLDTIRSTPLDPSEVQIQQGSSTTSRRSSTTTTSTTTSAPSGRSGGGDGPATTATTTTTTSPGVNPVDGTKSASCN